MAANKPYALFLSDEAWQRHARWAVENGWCYEDSINTVDNPGYTTRVSRWFVAISSLEYVDTRPDYMQDSPVWTNGEPVRRRTLRLPGAEVVLERLVALAFKHHIPPRWRQWATMAELPAGLPPILSDAHYKEAVLKASKDATALSYASAVLEAIGLAYLTPYRRWPIPSVQIATPKAQRYKRQRRVEQQIGERMGL